MSRYLGRSKQWLNFTTYYLYRKNRVPTNKKERSALHNEKHSELLPPKFVRNYSENVLYKLKSFGAFLFPKVFAV